MLLIIRSSLVIIFDEDENWAYCYISKMQRRLEPWKWKIKLNIAPDIVNWGQTLQLEFVVFVKQSIITSGHDQNDWYRKHLSMPRCHRWWLWSCAIYYLNNQAALDDIFLEDRHQSACMPFVLANFLHIHYLGWYGTSSSVVAYKVHYTNFFL